MKKIDSFYITKLFLIGGAAGILFMLATVIFWAATGLSGAETSVILYSLTMLFLNGFIITTVIVFTIGTNIIWKNNINKLESTFPQRSFSATSIFKGKNMMFYTDVTGGKIAMITKYNPEVLQIIDARMIENIKVSDIKGNGVTGIDWVSFSFTIDGKVWEIPTLISDRPLGLNSKKVTAAIAKADMQAEQLLAARKIAAERLG